MIDKDKIEKLKNKVKKYYEKYYYSEEAKQDEDNIINIIEETL